jgi:hydroxymethylpyrimidine pyrophosphatase-like HAD family hydrolase
VTDSHSVFISFADEDRAIADRVSDRLRRDGVKVWRYTESTESGSWHLNELRALRSSKVAVFIITEHSAASAACLDEAQRVADPGQLETVPVPLVVGPWNHETSDLWLLLSKWNGVVASPSLGEDALRRLADLVHHRLGSRPISSLSTGQALSAVKDDVCAFLENVAEVTSAEILHQAQELQLKHRGNMVAFAQFTHLDRELRAADLLAPAERGSYVRRYLEAFFETTVSSGYADVARRLATHIDSGDTIVISEYSRVIRQAIRIISESDPRLFQSLDFIVVGRTGLLLMADEPSRMEDEIRSLGAEPRVIPFAAWIDYLVGASDPFEIGHVDKLLFGVEAFSRNGDVVYPQIVKELDVLRTRTAVGSPISHATIIAAGESYKVCRDQREVSKMIADPHYTVMPPSALDLVITDVGEHRPDRHGTVDLSSCVEFVSETVDEIRQALWPTETPLPVWNLPRDVCGQAAVMLTDIDGSITVNDDLSLDALSAFGELERQGIKVVLTTGRSAGWASALGHYLPGVYAVIAENGAILVDRDRSRSDPILLDGWDADGLATRMERVEACLDEVLTRFPSARKASDNFTRLTDRTFEVSKDLDPKEIASIAAQFEVGYTYSSVHHHLSASTLDKQTGYLMAARNHLDLGEVDPAANVITLGDSLNDAPLFDQGRFAATVGVRDVLRHLALLGDCKPGYVTLGNASDGFVELAHLLLRSHLNPSRADASAPPRARRAA